MKEQDLHGMIADDWDTEEVTLSKPTRQTAKIELLKRCEDKDKTFHDRIADLINNEIEYSGGNPDTTINKISKALQKHSTDFDKEHHDILWKPKEWYPCGWMDRVKGISLHIKKWPGSWVFMNAIKKYEQPPLDFEYTVKEDDKKYRFFVADSDFYDEMVVTLGLAKSVIRKYLAALCKLGALKKIGVTGQFRNRPVYAFAYYTNHYSYGKQDYERLLGTKDKKQLKEFIP